VPDLEKGELTMSQFSAIYVPPTISALGAWASGTTYYQGSFVTYNGSAYYCTHVGGTTQQPGAGDHWQLYVSKGDAGTSSFSPQRYDQSSASSSWNISHSLGRVPHVQVFDTSGNAVTADVYATTTGISVAFSQPQTGFVIYQ
jgi:hypothetical protein